MPHLLEELSAHQPLVIVLDQFEEFFVRFRDRPAARAELVVLLGHIYREQAANIRLVFSLREDYYAELEDLRAELPELTRYGLRLLPLTAYGARQAIVRPLQHSHFTYEEPSSTGWWTCWRAGTSTRPCCRSSAPSCTATWWRGGACPCT
ncbi:hypothetical protein ACN28S_27015 [Cystobacter fuscus]